MRFHTRIGGDRGVLEFLGQDERQDKSGPTIGNVLGSPGRPKLELRIDGERQSGLVVVVEPVFHAEVGIAEAVGTDDVRIAARGLLRSAIEHIRHFVFELQSLADAVVHVQQRRLESPFAAGKIAAEGQVDLPIVGPRRLGIVGHHGRGTHGHFHRLGVFPSADAALEDHLDRTSHATADWPAAFLLCLLLALLFFRTIGVGVRGGERQQAKSQQENASMRCHRDSLNW